MTGSGLILPAILAHPCTEFIHWVCIMRCHLENTTKGFHCRQSLVMILLLESSRSCALNPRPSPALSTKACNTSFLSRRDLPSLFAVKSDRTAPGRGKANKKRVQLSGAGASARLGRCTCVWPQRCSDSFPLDLAHASSSQGPVQEVCRCFDECCRPWR